MKAITTPTALIKDTYNRTDVFEIVTEFPDGYIVWPIGRRNFPFPGYIPLAKPSTQRYHVMFTELKTIKVDEGIADYILHLATRGIMGDIDKAKFERIINSEL